MEQLRGYYIKQEGRSVNARLCMHRCLFPYFRDINNRSMIYITNALPVQCLQSLISYFNTARLAPIEKLSSLHQLALVDNQSGIQILRLYRFVSEEFNYNVPNYISS